MVHFAGTKETQTKGSDTLSWIYYTPQPYQTLHVFNMSISRFTVYSFQFYQQSLGPGLEFSELISLPLLKTLETGEDCMSEKLTTGENILEERL